MHANRIHNKRRQMYVHEDDDDDEVRDSSVLSRRRRKRKKVRPEVTTTLRPRSNRNKPHLMSNCVRRRMGKPVTLTIT